MSIGSSGRIVIEVDPTLKKDLYSALTKEGLSLKEWFLRGAAAYLENGSPLPLKLPEQIHGDQFLAGNNEKNKTQ
ncbi:hypothetical protein ACFQNF_19380 [Iodobacter arcticus]|uniref:Uncharacterized protein n=1 Tax=Iodobacter arcticus TaxID=590593 RepID=A0ABW2R420_9NEIS